VAGFCEYDNEVIGSITGNFLTSLTAINFST